MITTTTITLGSLIFNGEVCSDPIVDLIGIQNVALKCIDKTTGKYVVQSLDGSDLPQCLSFIVRCGTCSDCPPKVIERCLCGDGLTYTLPCHDCIGGILVDRCKNGEVCVDDTCKSCTVDGDCPCNQTCSTIGCICPPNSTLNPLNKCCDFCATNSDCGPCSDCINIGGVNTCVARDCGTGVCDVNTDSCVECLTSGDCANKSCTYCDPVLKRCVAGPNQVQLGNDCVPAPDCQTDVDCNDPCLSCGPAKTCVPIQCPPGKVPMRTGNTCNCVDSCDCDDPGSCADPTKYCSAVGPDTCGCISCEGDCASGCKDPCYCDPILNKCVANPCPPTACTDGSECGPGCGCDKTTNTCRPCAGLPCSDQSCANVLGCKCAGLSCVADDCGNKTCTTWKDCPFGCTCKSGKCVGCSNFACSPLDACTQQEGCKCNGTCKGDPDAECQDTLALMKDDTECSLTGSLQTDNCCQCSPLTLGIRGQRTTSDASTYTIVFQAELHKGEYDGVSLDANPLLDDVSNDNIAENEVPTSGTITYQAYTTYAIYKNFGSGYVYTGNSTEGPATGLASYIGGTAIVKFPAASFKKIGVTEQVDETTQREAVQVTIEFFQSSHLIAPNKCNYRATVEIGQYTILSDDDWLDFETTKATNGIGETITSTVCRDPFFKWRKDGVLFRKLYVNGTNGLYSDLLERPPVNDLESCSDYALEVDCSCEKSINDLVTFCNPASIDFDLTNCGKTFELKSFTTCGPNEDQDFYIKGGSLDITFKGSNPPVNVVYDSTKCIDKIEYGLVCDDECQTIYLNDCSDYTIDFETTCDQSGGTFTVTFDDFVTDGGGTVYSIDKITIAGFTLTQGTGFVKVLPWGTYTATVYPLGGCDPFEVVVDEDCCAAGVPEISRDCEGGVTCAQDTNVLYEVNGVIQTDICAYVNSLPADQSVSIVIRKGSCPIRTITLPSLDSFCCDNFNFVIEQQSDTTALVQTYFAGEGAILKVAPAAGVAIEQSGPTEYYVSNLIPGQTYNFTVESQTCGTLTLPYGQTDCNLTVGLTQPAAPNCDSLIATVNSQTCQCKYGEFRAQVTDVDTTDPNYVAVTFQTSVQQFDAGVATGTIVFTDQEGVETDLGCTTCIKTVTFPKPIEIECLSGISMLVNLETGPADLYTLKLKLKQSGTDLVDLPNIQSTSIKLGTTTVSSVDVDNNYVFSSCCVNGAQIILSVTIVDTDNKTYTATITVTPTVDLPLNYILGSVCTDGDDYIEAALSLTLKDLTLVDNCEYPDVSRKFTYYANSQTVAPSSPQTIGLTAIDEDARWVKFVWYENGSPVYTEFAPSQSVLANTYLDQGSTYKVSAVCDPCMNNAEKDFCCLPVVTFTEDAHDSFDITIQGLPGTYNVDVEGTPYVVTLTGTGILSDTITYNGPLTPEYDYTVTVSISGTSCTQEWIYTAPELVIPLLRFSACNPGTGFYEIYVDNAKSNWVVAILSGTGNIGQQGVGMALINLDETDPPVFQITANTVKSSVIVGTSPTSCYSSSTAFTSSSIGASSVAMSSSPAASSSATSSIIPPSSVLSSSAPVSSSVAMSSSAPISSASPPASSNPSSSQPAPSSSPVPSSSYVAPSSSAVPSSTGVIPSSCPTLLAITQSTVSCSYSLAPENPDTGTSTNKVVYVNDSFLGTVSLDCVTTSSCEGEYDRSTFSRNFQVFAYRANFSALQSGDVADTIHLWDGSSWLAIDISPGGHTTSCGCSGCGSVNASDLTYNGSNGTAFATAIKQAIINGICAENSYVNGTNYQLAVDFSGSTLRVGFANKNNPSTLLMLTDASGNTTTGSNDIVTRAGVGKIDIGGGAAFQVGNTLFDQSWDTVPCSTTTGCGALSKNFDVLGVSSGAAANWGSVTPTGNPFSATPANQSCNHAELVATLTGGSCSPVYAWTGPGIIAYPTHQTIYVTTPGTYDVDVTGCTGCGTLEDSEIVS